MRTILLLVASNVFMTFAWYGHLRYKGFPLWAVILASWLIALPEYALQVPANRLGHGYFSAPQLKILQEAISISVFLVFCGTYLKEPVRWNHMAGLGLIFLGVFIGLRDMPQAAAAEAAPPALTAPE
ncbi:MAG: DMT family protein [Elusimicrobia bacterium]|nr:DMT family protein [Elusimicrobiota bacterium]